MVWWCLLHVAKAISNFCPVCFSKIASCGFQQRYIKEANTMSKTWEHAYIMPIKAQQNIDN